MCDLWCSCMYSDVQWKRKTEFQTSKLITKTCDMSGHADSSSARWSALRRAFVSAVAASKGRTGETMAAGQDSRQKTSFEGFKFFPREEQTGLFDGGDVLAMYRLPDGSQVKTREAPSDGAPGRPPVTLEQIFSHRIHGIDNTGNVRVWPAEQVLLHALLTGPLVSSLSGARVLELGAGKCGLAGLGLAVGSAAAEVVITDGNPEALENLQACLELNEKEGSFGETKVTASRLVWDRWDRDGAVAELMASSSGPRGFDLVIASDCLFFKEFHDDLRSTIAHLLAPRGRAILVQPQRGGTLDLFLRCVASVKPAVAAAGGATAATAAGANSDADNERKKQCAEPPLYARLVRRFDERVRAMHLDYAKKGCSDTSYSGYNGYTPDRHLPLLVELCRMSRKRSRGIGSDQDGDSPSLAEEEASTGDEDILWTPWPENPLPVPPTATALQTKTEAGEGREMEGNADDDTDQSTSAMTAVLGEEQAGPPPSSYSPKLNPNTSPNYPSSSVLGVGGERHVAAGPLTSAAASTTLTAGSFPVASAEASPAASVTCSLVSVTLKGPRDRPDRKMDSVYRDLAERLIVKVRDGRTSAKRRHRQQQQQQQEGERKEEQGGGVEGEEGQQQQQLWVAVAGAPGSGKSTLAAEVYRRVQEVCPAVCLPMDGFHLYRKELDAMPDPAEAHRRRGAHWTFNGDRFVRDVAEARKKFRGSFPGFDHAVGDPVENACQVCPFHEVVIVEGNYLLLKGVDPWDKARGLFDEIWAIQCPPEVCAERVRKRHVETGLSDAEARIRVQTNDLPNARLVQNLCPWGEVDVVIQSL